MESTPNEIEIKNSGANYGTFQLWNYFSVTRRRLDVVQLFLSVVIFLFVGDL